jgi:peptidyl-dipeptidase A
MEIGSSKHWSFALKMLTSEEKVTSDAFIQYFRPLADWLEIENAKYEAQSK